jgi:hypothetical protein
VETANCSSCSKLSSLWVLDTEDPGLCFRTWGETRRGETTRCKVRLSGECLAYVFLTGVREFVGSVEFRRDVFFLIDKGSIGVAIGIALDMVDFGVESVLLTAGKRGWRLLLLIPGVCGG